MDIFLFRLSKDLELTLQVAGLPLVGLLVLVVLGYLLLKWWLDGRSGEITLDSAEFGFGDSKITLKPRREDRQIAYAIWVELSTRKIGLQIDPKDDVISEVYDSWYSFFGVTRELIKLVPVEKLKNESTRQIIGLSIEVLNRGIRPHLTQWQARFRHWYERKMDQKTDASPQEVQQDFPEYDALVADLLDVNSKLIRYREKMYEILHGNGDPAEKLDC